MGFIYTTRKVKRDPWSGLYSEDSKKEADKILAEGNEKLELVDPDRGDDPWNEWGTWK